MTVESHDRDDLERSDRAAESKDDHRKRERNQTSDRVHVSGLETGARLSLQPIAAIDDMPTVIVEVS